MFYLEKYYTAKVFARKIRDKYYTRTRKYKSEMIFVQTWYFRALYDRLNIKVFKQIFCTKNFKQNI